MKLRFILGLLSYPLLSIGTLLPITVALKFLHNPITHKKIVIIADDTIATKFNYPLELVNQFLRIEHRDKKQLKKLIPILTQDNQQYLFISRTLPIDSLTYEATTYYDSCLKLIPTLFNQSKNVNIKNINFISLDYKEDRTTILLEDIMRETADPHNFLLNKNLTIPIAHLTLSQHMQKVNDTYTLMIHQISSLPFSYQQNKEIVKSVKRSYNYIESIYQKYLELYGSQARIIDVLATRTIINNPTQPVDPYINALENLYKIKFYLDLFTKINNANVNNIIIQCDVSIAKVTEYFLIKQGYASSIKATGTYLDTFFENDEFSNFLSSFNMNNFLQAFNITIFDEPYATYGYYIDNLKNILHYAQERIDQKIIDFFRY